MEHPIDKNLLRKYLHNACTIEEMILVERFLKQKGSNDLLHELMQEEPAEPSPDSYKYQTLNNSEIAGLHQKVLDRIETAEIKSSLPLKKKPFFMRYAAVWAFLAIGLSTTIFLYQRKPPKDIRHA